jgi:hypothetical protein
MDLTDRPGLNRNYKSRWIAWEVLSLYLASKPHTSEYAACVCKTGKGFLDPETSGPIAVPKFAIFDLILFDQHHVIKGTHDFDR